MSADEERIALFLDYENLAIGARENLGGMAFDFKPVADALAERGRVLVRRAYADWLKFGEDGRMLTRAHVELIEIPQRMGSVRKNAADIKMAVDALEMCFAKDYITTFVLGTGDSDFTPLVHKLRELNRRVIGLGVQMSTSALLPPACDEFLFYERLEGVEVPKRRIVARGRGRRRPQVGDVGDVAVDRDAEVERETETAADVEAAMPTTMDEVDRLLTQTLAGLERSGAGPVRASALKRAILRKQSTFSETDLGFRGFTELLRSLVERGVVELSDTAGLGDPEVNFPTESTGGEEGAAFELIATVVSALSEKTGSAPLSGLKTQLRRHQPEFSEKRFGFGGFLQFAKAAAARGVIQMAWNDEADDYLLRPADGSAPTPPTPPTETGEAPSAGGRGRRRSARPPRDVRLDPVEAQEMTENLTERETNGTHDFGAEGSDFNATEGGDPASSEAMAARWAEAVAAAESDPTWPQSVVADETPTGVVAAVAEPEKPAEPEGMETPAPAKRRRTTSRTKSATEAEKPAIVAGDTDTDVPATPRRTRRSTRATPDPTTEPTAEVEAADAAPPRRRTRSRRTTTDADTASADATSPSDAPSSDDGGS